MKIIKYKNVKNLSLILLTISLVISCEREISDDAVDASFSMTGEVYTDSPVGLGSDFYFPYADSKFTAFSIDNNVAYQSASSIRIDVPNDDDPLGTYAGGIFRIDGAGRDLTGYDALTFWAKASQGVSIGEIGFGEDFLENKFIATRTNVSIGTGWAKYIIPIPDPSKLTQERGVLRYAAGTQETNGSGYTFWIDELRFETLGTLAQARPVILDGQDQLDQTFIGSQLTLSGLSQTVNSANGDILVIPATGYFEFNSSNPTVAAVDTQGNINVIGTGTTVITASLSGVDAQGSLTLESLGNFVAAPVPTRDPTNVISIFSDTYNDVPVDYFNGFFNGDGQTTLGGAPPANFGGGQVINYTNLNFVGIGTFLNVAPIDATQMTHLHVDINVQEMIDAGDTLTLQILNGVQTANETSGSRVINGPDLITNGWVSLDIPLGEFNGLGQRDALGLLFFISNGISNIYVDNIYYYKDVVLPSPNVDDSAATQVALPIGFESSLTYNFIGFEGANSSIEINPMATGINPTTTVMRSIKTAGAQFFAGTALELDAPIDFSTSQKFRMKIISPKAGIPIRVRLENAGNTVGIELDANTTTLNEWEELEWDFSSLNTSASYVRVVVFFEFIPSLAGDGSTYYFDDIQIVN